MTTRLRTPAKRIREPTPATDGWIRRGAICLLALLGACSERNREGWLAAPQSLAVPAAPGSRFPRLASGPSGELVLSWLEPHDASFALRYARWTGDGWGPAQTVASGADWFVNWADSPSVVPLGAGRLAAHWLQQVPGSTYAYRVRIAVSGDGQNWSAPMSPHDDVSATEHGFVTLWPSGTGLQAAWLDGRKTKEGDDVGESVGAMTLHTALIDEHGSRSGGDLELDARVCDCCQTDAASTGDGAILVFRDRDADEVRDIASVTLQGSMWSAPRPVHVDGWKISACPVNGPAVAARGREVAVAWFTATDRPRVRLAWSHDAGRSFDTPLEVAAGNVTGRVDVVVPADGRAVVTWLAGSPDATLRAQPFDRNGPAGPAVTVSPSPLSQASGFPQIAAVGDTLVFAWTDTTGTPSVRSVGARLR